jgi:hypothetical protein
MTGRKRSSRSNDTRTGGITGRSLSGTNLERAGGDNQRVTLHAIRVNGPVTRPDLVPMTGLTAAAIPAGSWTVWRRG